MTRTFIYNFMPPSFDPSPGATIALDVSEIEDAGIREVLQTPGAAYGAWSILDALLARTGAGTSFIFRQPLGQAREVKVALSGLFGRFVARAYLERYFSLSLRSEPKTVVFVPIPWVYTNQPPARDKTP